MADIANTDVTYSFIQKDKMFLGRRGYSARGTISFGNGTLTYPSGGIPLIKGKIGLPRVLRSIKILESNAKGYQFEYDVSAEKIRLFQSPSKAVTGNASAPTVSFASNSGNVAADKVIGVNALSNGASLVANTALVNVTGVQAPTLTMDNVAVGRFAELSGDAVQAVVLEVECEGY